MTTPIKKASAPSYFQSTIISLKFVFSVTNFVLSILHRNTQRLQYSTKKVAFGISFLTHLIKAYKNKPRLDPALQLPNELMLMIFSMLKIEDLANCSRTCHKWHQLANDPHFWNHLFNQKIFFGQNDWEKIGLKIENAPQLSRALFKKLSKPCPFYSGKTIDETHYLILMPKQLTILKLYQIALSTKKMFISMGNQVRIAANDPTTDSYWILIPKIPFAYAKASNMTCSEFKKTLVKFNQRNKTSYKEAHLIEVLTKLLAVFIKSNEFLYPSDQFAYSSFKVKKMEGLYAIVGGMRNSVIGPEIQIIEKTWGKNYSISVAERL